MTSRLLLVEDDPDLGPLLAECLADKGYQTILVGKASEALSAIAASRPALCILDIELPDQSGLELARRIRAEFGKVPVFFLTAKSTAEDRIRGLRLGANDYITKPFRLEELVLRIGNFLDTRKTEDPGQIAVGTLCLDTERLQLSSATEVRTLTQRECGILELLVRDRGKVVRRDHIMRTIWGRSDYFTGRSLDVFISRLRKHLCLDPRLRITTVRSVGYVLERS